MRLGYCSFRVTQPFQSLTFHTVPCAAGLTGIIPGDLQFRHHIRCTMFKTKITCLPVCMNVVIENYPVLKQHRTKSIIDMQPA